MYKKQKENRITYFFLIFLFVLSTNFFQLNSVGYYQDVVLTKTTNSSFFDIYNHTVISNFNESLELPYGVSKKNNTIYIAEPYYGLHLIDISNKSNPNFIQFINKSTTYIVDVIVDGTILYAASRWNLRTYDITFPENPINLDTISINDSSGLDTISKYGDFLYCPIKFDEVAYIINVTNPTKLTVAGVLDKNFYDCAIQGNIGYFAAGFLWIIDLSNFSNPVALKRIEELGEVWDVDAKGNICYLTSDSLGFVIYDISNYDSFIEIGRFDDGRDYSDMIFLDDFVILLQRGRGGFKIINIVDKTNPILASQYLHDYFDHSTLDIIHDDYYCFVGTVFLGLEIISIDFDRDGLHDAEEVSRYFTDPENNDTDGDGFSDWEEILAGSDPLNPNNASTEIVLVPTYLIIVVVLVVFHFSSKLRMKKFTSSNSS